MLRAASWAALLAGSFANALWAQTSCPPTPAWSTCDVVFDLEPNENVANVQLHVEFRSPHHHTYMLEAFHDSDRKLTVRVAPTEAGSWEYRVSSNIARWDGRQSQFIATDSDSPGFIHVANVHHFLTEGNNKQHLWMATAFDKFVAMPRADFDRVISERAMQKFTHLRVTLAPGDDLREASDRMRAINAKGMVVDLALATIPADRAERDRYLRDIIARFAPMNLTWMGTPSFDDRRTHPRRAQNIRRSAQEVRSLRSSAHHPRVVFLRRPGGRWMDEHACLWHRRS